MSNNAMSFSLSQPNLSQSQTSIQNLGTLDSQLLQTSQIQTYCTLPRQMPRQPGTLSAFQPVQSKSAPITPRISRPVESANYDVTNQFPQRNDLQSKGHIEIKGEMRSRSQPSSPSRGQGQPFPQSIYTAKTDSGPELTSAVRVLPTGTVSATQSGNSYCHQFFYLNLT